MKRGGVIQIQYHVQLCRYEEVAAAHGRGKESLSSREKQIMTKKCWIALQESQAQQEQIQNSLVAREQVANAVVAENPSEIVLVTEEEAPEAGESNN